MCRFVMLGTCINLVHSCAGTRFGVLVHVCVCVLIDLWYMHRSVSFGKHMLFHGM